MVTRVEKAVWQNEQGRVLLEEESPGKWKCVPAFLTAEELWAMADACQSAAKHHEAMTRDAAVCNGRDKVTA